MNIFAYLTDDVVGRLATVNTEEIYEKSIDEDSVLKETCNMTKEQYKEKSRQERLARTNNYGLYLKDLMQGKVKCRFDNSHIWAFREQIAAEVAPQIRKRQLAWINN